MMNLSVKILFLLSLPVSLVFIWRTRTHASWLSLAFGFGAYAVYHLARKPWGQLVPFLLNHIEVYLPKAVWPYWILIYLLSGLLHVGTRWLILRYLATNVRSWREGVMFGIGFGSIAMLVLVGQQIVGLEPDSNLFRTSLVERMTTLRYLFRWWRTLIMAWHWGVSSMVLHVCTSLFVLFSVQRRDARLLLAALMLYVAFFCVPLIVLERFAFELQVGTLSWRELRQTRDLLAHIPLGLLMLWLIFRLRKPMGQTEFG